MDARRRLAQQLHELPLPIAQLVRRALNAKSALERHHNAFYLAEATLKLAATARIGVWLEHCLEPGGEIERVLESLVMPSLGHWCGYLRALDKALAERPDAALLPLSDGFGQLSAPRDLPACLAFAEAARAADVVPQDTPKRVKKQGVQAFFDALVAYRNAVLGHGAQRPKQFYADLGDALLEAYTEVLETGVLLGDRRLVQVTPSEDGVGWRDLTGLSGLPVSRDDLPALPASAKPVPGHLYLVGTGELIALHPLAVFHEDALEREVVGLLNKTVRRTKRTGEAEIDEVRRADYLDYASGEIIEGVDARGTLTELLSRLRARPVSDAEVAAVEDASRVGDEEDVADVVSGGAAIGDFEILDELGRGGMGIVYRARQRTLGRIVALKVLPPALAANETAVKRFQQEVKALARADHPNVVRILSSGVSNDRHFFAMEFVDGSDLAAVTRALDGFRSQGGLSDRSLAEAVEVSRATDPQVTSRSVPSSGPRYFRRVAELFADVARGLHQLHEAGIVHRDVKPHNLVLSSDGTRLVLMDLGLALLADRSEALTKTTTGVLGTLRYAAPEQLGPERASLDRRADVYGLGATLYQMVTGRPPHDADTEGALLRQILDTEPPAPRKVDPSVPADLDAILRVALERDRKRRYPTALAFAQDLERFAAGEPVRARPGGIGRAVARFLAARPAAVALTLVLMLLGVLGVGGLSSAGLYWLSSLPTHVYAHDLDWIHSVPNANVEVSRAEQRRRWRTHRLTIEDGRVTRVDYVNAHDVLVQDEEGVSSWIYTYRDNGAVSRIDTYDDYGTLKAYYELSPDLLTQRRYTPQGTPALVPGSQVSAYTFEYGDRGHVTKQTHRNIAGHYVRNGDGIGSYIVERDPRGLITKLTYLDEKGRPTPRTDGVFAAHREYDARGFMVAESMHTADGRLFEVGGIATTRLTYDAVGNNDTTSFFDADGAPTPNPQGVAKWVWTFDGWGQPITQRAFDAAGQPTSDAQTRAHLVRFEHDARGNRSRTAYFDTSDQPTWSAEAYHATTMVWDEHNSLVEQRFFDTEGNPTTFGDDTWHRSEWTRDAHGLDMEERHYDVAGAPVRTRAEGAFGSRSTYDRYGQRVRLEWLDTDGSIMLAPDGYAIEELTWELGNEVGYAFFDASGAPVVHRDGNHAARIEYDEAGNETRRTYLGLDGAPVALREGFATRIQGRDDRGNVARLRYLDAADAPVLHPDCACSGWNDTYDAVGNLVSRHYLDASQQPGPDDEGIWGFRSTWDARNHEVRRDLLGPDDAPLLASSGYAAWTATYDDQGNQVTVTWLGLDGRPLMQPEGMAGKRMAWDARGRMTSLTFVGVDGQPVNLPAGYATILLRYPYALDDESRYAVRLAADGTPLPLAASGWIVRASTKANMTSAIDPGIRLAQRIVSIAEPGAGGLQVGDLLLHVECAAPGDDCVDGSDLEKPGMRNDATRARAIALRGEDVAALEEVVVELTHAELKRLSIQRWPNHGIVLGDPDAWVREHWMP
ncbi:MAG: protein kinase [Alphaproteobacteria bacterium]|nr:protein kinase [Alphaproteobacteria bacterium]